MLGRAATPSRRPAWRSWGRWAIALLVLNEIRGVCVVVSTWPVWWPILEATWRAGTGGGHL